MALFGINLEDTQIISPNLRVMVLPVGSLLALVILLFVSFSLIIPKITDQSDNLKDTQREITILEEKLDILRSVREDVLDSADTSLLAVPSENPSVWTLAQLVQAARENSIEVLSRQVKSGRTTEGLSSSPVSMGVEGERDPLFDFFERVYEIAPLVIIENIEMKTDNQGTSVGVELLVYSAPLPKKLPAITTPVKNLTNQERELLSRLESLQPPQFTVLSPNTPIDRVDPFN
ncbi:MAG: type 4a pilus biogenesis protein PilO [Candidatus Woesebacteria bacterium]|jgi:Tfp pilus assembly protein PilO